MFNELKKIGTFVKRDFRMLFTYKFAFFTTVLSTAFLLFYVVLIASMFGVRDVPAIAPYGGDFIAYAFIGGIGWMFLWSIMNATALSLRKEMFMGTLESILLTPTRVHTMMVSYTIFGTIFGLISISILSLIGFFFLGVSFPGNVYTLIIMLFSVLLMMGFGMIFGGLTIWIKNIGQAVPLVQNIALFFCGVFFPITVLPGFLQVVAKGVPFYYSIEGLRMSLIPTTPTSELIMHMVILLMFAISFILVGLYTLRKGLAKARKDGTLSFY